jgi:hypothetical protein
VKRRAIQVVVLDGYLVSLCDDGTMWFQSKNPQDSMRWFPLPEIPQVSRAEVKDGVVMMVRSQASSEQSVNGSQRVEDDSQRVDQLVVDELMDGRSAAAEETTESAVATAPAKPVAAKPGAGKAASQEKPAAPPAKTKPKRAVDDEDAEPRVAVKYWVTLGVLAAMLTGYLVWPSGVMTPEGLANRAVSSRDPEDRRLAAVELSMLKTPDVLPAIRRVLKESKDPEVITTVLGKIFTMGKSDDIAQQVVLLDAAEEKVRVAAAAGFNHIYGGSFPDGLVYDPKGPAEERSKVRRTLQEKYDAMNKKAMDDLNNTK